MPTVRPRRTPTRPPTNGVVVIPDILCNAGGVVVSYLEWVQNRNALQMARHEIKWRLGEFMERAATVVWDRMQQERIDARLAAHAIAVERVAEATALRGFYP